MAFEAAGYQIATKVLDRGQRVELSLGLTLEQSQALAKELEGSGPELCLRLGAWTLYVKRAPQSKAIAAHPDPASWVGTLALNEVHHAELRATLDAGESFTTARWVTPGRFQNLLVLFDIL